MKKLLLFLTLALGWSAWSQPVIPTTAYTRYFLLATNALDGTKRLAFQVDNISELVALIPATGSTDSKAGPTNVWVNGYNSVGDGGGGPFSYDPSSSAATNVWDTFKPTSFNGRWIRGSIGTTGLQTSSGVINGQLIDWGDSMANFLGSPLQAQTPLLVYNYGVGGETSSQVLTRILADTNHAVACIETFWMGRNNYNATNQVFQDISNAVASITSPKRYLVFSILNGDYASEYVGGANYQVITNLNGMLADRYGTNYLDIRTNVIAHYNPAIPQDVIDHANDVPPSSLRLDNIHLNALGNAVASTQIVARLTSLYPGYVVPARDDLISFLASPPSIGVTNAAPGTFSALNSTGIVSVLGGQIHLRKADGTGSQVLQPSGDGNSAQFSGTSVFGYPSNSVSLGLSSYPWSDLYSQLAHITGSSTFGGDTTFESTVEIQNNLTLTNSAIETIAGGYLALRLANDTGSPQINCSGDGLYLQVYGSGAIPATNNAASLGTSGNQWSTIYTGTANHFGTSTADSTATANNTDLFYNSNTTVGNGRYILMSEADGSFAAAGIGGYFSSRTAGSRAADLVFLSTTGSVLSSNAVLTAAGVLEVKNIGSTSAATGSPTATGWTNATTITHILWVTAATSAALLDNAGATEFSGVTIAAFTPIRIQPGGKFTGTSITYATGSGAHAW